MLLPLLAKEARELGLRVFRGLRGTKHVVLVLNHVGVNDAVGPVRDVEEPGDGGNEDVGEVDHVLHVEDVVVAARERLEKVCKGIVKQGLENHPGAWLRVPHRVRPGARGCRPVQ